MNKTNKPILFIEIIFFCALGLIPRLVLLNHNHAGIESDEAIVGLMAKHILEGSDLPIFYYGQSYMGSLEPIFTSLSFKLFGVSNLSIKLVPLFFSIILILSNYLLGNQLRGAWCARISALLTAIGPSPLIVWSLKARGGFIETVALGTLCLLFAAKLFTENNKKPDRQFNLICILGLLAGIGWWTNNQIIFYYPSLALAAVYSMMRFKALDNLKTFLGGLIAFFIGSSPFWYYNLTSKPKWATFEVLFGKTAGSNKLEYFQSYWDTALPIILGARKFWSSSEVFEGATFSVYFTYSLVVLYLLIKTPKEKKRFQTTNYDPKVVRKSYYFLITFLTVVPIIFSTSSFGWLSQAPRYLLPLYSVVPVFCGLCLSTTHRLNLRQILISGSILILLLGLNLSSNYVGGIADEGQPMLYKGQRVSSDQSELYKWLKENNYKHVFTNYWVGYRMAFETNEEITFSVFGEPKTVRIKEYQDKENSKPFNFANKVFVLAPLEAEELKYWLKSSGYCYRSHNVSNYTIIHSILNKYPEGKLIELSDSQFRSFIPPDNSNRKLIAQDFKSMLDKSFSTRWGSGAHQTLGMAIEIDFPTPTWVHRALIQVGEFKNDTPRYFNISGIQSDDKKRVELFTNYHSSEIKYGQLSSGYEFQMDWDIRFTPKKLDMLRMELIEGTAVYDWSIAELELFSPDSGNLKIDKPFLEDFEQCKDTIN